QVGDEVLALAPGAFSTYITVPAQFVVAKPACLSIEEAATIAVPFFTAYYALHHIGNIQSGERVLIHAAAGGVGLAAVQLAQRAGAEVFATAGSEAKRAYLRSLGVERVMDSRSLKFADEVMAATNGQGVELVLNSLAGDFAAKSLAVLADNGRFLELGKRDLLDQQQVANLGRPISYFAVDWTETAIADPALIGTLLRRLVRDFADGALKASPVRVFPIGDAVAAFRYMAQAKHIGKIAITQPVPTVPFERTVSIHPGASYLVTGGLGGLGLIVAGWLVEHGARHLVLMGRTAPTDQVRERLHQFEEAGVQVLVAQADVGQSEQVAGVLRGIGQSMPALRGIVHAAGVLDDGVLAQQQWPRFVKVMGPKVTGAWNLHSLTRGYDLDFFVLFSSASSLLGSPGQSNYAAANAFLDALAHYRFAHGQPALSINWGPWAGAGMAARLDKKLTAKMVLRGFHDIAPKQGLQAFGHLIRQPRAQVAVLPIDWHQWQHSDPSVAGLRLLEHFVGQSSGQPEIGEASHTGSAVLGAPATERQHLVQRYLVEQVAAVLGLDVSRLDVEQPLIDLGMDSLMAVEVKNRVQSDLGVSILATSLIEGHNTVQLTMQVLDRLPAKTALPPSAGQTHQSRDAEERGVDHSTAVNGPSGDLSPKPAESRALGTAGVSISMSGAKSQSTARAQIDSQSRVNTGGFAVGVGTLATHSRVSGAGNEPFFFGRPESPLYGCYHPPATVPSRDCGIVVCQPMAQEYIRSHRACRQLATRLARAGFPVLRFDYYGTGDSGGESEDARVALWRANLEHAVQELRARSTASRVSLVGLRLGATLAMMFGAEQEMVDDLVLWEPIVSGPSYLAEIIARHEEALNYFTTRPKREKGDAGGNEVLGFALSEAMQAELAAIDLLSLSRRPANRALVLQRQLTPAARSLTEHLQVVGSQSVLRHVAAPEIWTEDPDKALVPHETLENIVAWLSEVKHA
ncbi:MAG: SDR family NAD(P)-dependent oxidoreductase, partial [Chloroflexota bacterium]